MYVLKYEHILPRRVLLSYVFLLSRCKINIETYTQHEKTYGIYVGLKSFLWTLCEEDIPIELSSAWKLDEDAVEPSHLLVDVRYLFLVVYTCLEER